MNKEQNSIRFISDINDDSESVCSEFIELGSAINSESQFEAVSLLSSHQNSDKTEPNSRDLLKEKDSNSAQNGTKNPLYKSNPVPGSENLSPGPDHTHCLHQSCQEHDQKITQKSRTEKEEGTFTEAEMLKLIKLLLKKKGKFFKKTNFVEGGSLSQEAEEQINKLVAMFKGKPQPESKLIEVIEKEGRALGMEMKDFGSIAASAAKILSQIKSVGMERSQFKHFEKYNFKSIMKESDFKIQNPSRMEVEGCSHRFLIMEDKKEMIMNFHPGNKLCTSRLLNIVKRYSNYNIGKIIDLGFEDDPKDQPGAERSKGLYLVALKQKKSSKKPKKKPKRDHGSIVLFLDLPNKSTKMILNSKERLDLELDKGLRYCRRSRLAGYQTQGDSIMLWTVTDKVSSKLDLNQNSFFVSLSLVKESKSTLIEDFCLFSIPEKRKETEGDESEWEVMEEGGKQLTKEKSLVDEPSSICVCLDSHGGLILFKVSDRCDYQYLNLKQLILNSNQASLGHQNADPSQVRYEFKAVHARFSEQKGGLPVLSEGFSQLEGIEKAPDFASLDFSAIKDCRTVALTKGNQEGYFEGSRTEGVEILVIFNQIKKGATIFDHEIKSQHLAILRLEKTSTETGNTMDFSSEPEGLKITKLGSIKLFDFTQVQKAKSPKISFSGLHQTYQILIQTENLLTKEVHGQYFEVPSPANHNQKLIQINKMRLVGSSKELLSSFGFYSQDDEKDPEKRGLMKLAHFNHKGYLTFVDVEKLKVKLARLVLAQMN